MIFVGDIMLDRYIEEINERKGINYFFERLIEKE